MSEKLKIPQNLIVDHEMAQLYSCPFCNCIPYDNELSCSKCGKLYCSDCLEIKNYICVDCRNQPNKTSFRNLQRVVQQQIHNLMVKCAKCSATFKLEKYKDHMKICGNPKCDFEACGELIKPEKNFKIKEPKHKEKFFCSLECKYAFIIKQINKDNRDEYERQVKNIMACLMTEESLHEECKKPSVMAKSSIVLNPKVEFPNPHELSTFMVSSDGACEFSWDSSNGTNVLQFTNGNKWVFLQETGYFFRTVIGNKYFKSGVFYWEIEADERTDNELKIGVSTKKDFNLNSSFSDHEFGFAFYGLGQLRHGSNAAGNKYGKNFKNKKGDYLGVCLDMNKGTLSFALNNEFLGVAFTDEALRHEPIYAAVSLLHKAGMKLRTGIPLPPWFII